MFGKGSKKGGELRTQRPVSAFAGIGMASLLSVCLLIVPLGQSTITLASRGLFSDVMFGTVAGFAFDSELSAQLLWFVLGLVVLHVLFALAIHALALLTGFVVMPWARHRHALVVLWFTLTAGSVLLLNGQYFPRSNAGTYYWGIATRQLGPLTLAEWISGFVAISVLIILCIAAARWMFARPWNRSTVLSRSAIGVAMFAVIVGAGHRHDLGASNVDPSRPNIVILGIDSLRLEQLQRFGGGGATPHLDALLDDADIFTDTTTPLARTFPAWVSILTGRSPRSTGAIFNLAPRDTVIASPTIADILAATGYRTIFATDEVRFANIDESYGFDQVITPPIGAADFLIGAIADAPLSNVVSNLALGRVLLRFLHANRAVAFLYQPESFLSRLNVELPEDRPVFAAIHLTAAHWPYVHARSAGVAEHQPGNQLDPAYMDGLSTADKMVGETLGILRKKGILENAILVILSDHGEALGLDTDSLVRQANDRITGLHVPIPVSSSGHGQSVLSPVQYQVLLGFKNYGRSTDWSSAGRSLTEPASLEDLAPTLLGMINIAADAEMDGISLAGVLRHGEPSLGDLSGRIRFTETDIRVVAAANGAIDEDGTARWAARFFEVDPASGWLQVRSEVVSDILLMKERAAVGRTKILAAMPIAPAAHLYLLLDRFSGVGMVLLGRPNEPDDLEGARLWDALQKNFGKELKPPISPRPGDLPEIEAEWAQVASLN